MNHIACQNESCSMSGWPFTIPEDAEESPNCTSCGEVMTLIEEPVAVSEEDPTIGTVYEMDPADFAPLEVRQQRAVLSIRSILVETDMWAIRHAEDSTSLTPERIAYRQRLRELLVEAERSDNPESIKLPDKPTA